MDEIQKQEFVRTLPMIPHEMRLQIHQKKSAYTNTVQTKTRWSRLYKLDCQKTLLWFSCKHIFVLVSPLVWFRFECLQRDSVQVFLVFFMFGVSLFLAKGAQRVFPWSHWWFYWKSLRSHKVLSNNWSLPLWGHKIESKPSLLHLICVMYGESHSKRLSAPSPRSKSYLSSVNLGLTELYLISSPPVTCTGWSGWGTHSCGLMQL